MREREDGDERRLAFTRNDVEPCDEIEPRVTRSGLYPRGLSRGGAHDESTAGREPARGRFGIRLDSAAVLEAARRALRMLRFDPFAAGKIRRCAGDERKRVRRVEGVGIAQIAEPDVAAIVGAVPASDRRASERLTSCASIPETRARGKRQAIIMSTDPMPHPMSSARGGSIPPSARAAMQAVTRSSSDHLCPRCFWKMRQSPERQHLRPPTAPIAPVAPRHAAADRGGPIPAGGAACERFLPSRARF